MLYAVEGSVMHIQIYRYANLVKYGQELNFGLGLIMRSMPHLKREQYMSIQ